MRATAKEGSTNGLVDPKRTPRVGKRRNWPEAFKSQVAAETLEPGSSVSIVARRHDLNTNQLFRWRRETEIISAERLPLLRRVGRLLLTESWRLIERGGSSYDAD